jgi:histidinol-phosphatase (PHP family)
VTETWSVDHPGQLQEWAAREVFDVWAEYFRRLTLLAESKLCDIIGHADLPKKFGHRPDRDCTPLFTAMLDAARRSNCAIELNTAGLRKDCREIYPSSEILRLAHARGVPITFGSDAHAPEEVGLNFSEAVALARQMGYTTTCRFVRRQRQFVPLP